MSIKEIQKEYHTPCFKLFMKYFEKLRQANWEKLDVITGDEVLKLQGENRLLKDFLSLSKEKREVKYAEHDGGFGER